MAKKIKKFGEHLHDEIKKRKDSDKTFTFKRVASEVIQKNGKRIESSTLTGMLNGDQEMLFRYVPQILKKLDIAIYLDGKKFFEVPQNLNIEQLIKDSKTLEGVKKSLKPKPKEVTEKKKTKKSTEKKTLNTQNTKL